MRPKKKARRKRPEPVRKRRNESGISSAQRVYADFIKKADPVPVEA